MSDEVIDVADEDPIVDGQVDDGDNASPEELSELTEFDLEQYKDQTVEITVDGEVTRVPLAELRNGYMRQSAFTKRTQELAAERGNLQWAAGIRGALDQDPAGTLQLLRDHYGLNGQVEADGTVADPWASPDVDPQIVQLNQRIAAFEQREAQSQLENEVARLASKYGEDFDPQEVVSAAFARQSTDLEGVFKTIAFDRVVAKQAKAATVAAKREAQVVSGGRTTSSAASGDSPAINSISDAYRAAMRDLAR